MTTLEKIIEQIKSGQAENITEIDLSHNQIGYRGAIALSKALIEAKLSLPRLEYINLCYSQIGDRGAAAIAEALKEANLPNLEQIDLSCNQIGDRGAAAIAEALIEANLPNLEQIDLSCNQIGDQGAVAIAEALKEANLPNLEWINLSANLIASQGTAAIAEALIEASLPHLKSLDITLNPIGHKEIDAVAKALENINSCYTEAAKEVKQKLLLNWRETAETIKKALIDIEHAKLLQNQGKLKEAIGLYGAALHGFRFLSEVAPEFLDIKQIVKQTAEDMIFAINKLDGKVEELKLPVYLLECFEHLNAKAFEQDLLKLFVDRGIKNIWEPNLVGVIFNMIPYKKEPASFLDMFSKLAAVSSEEDSEDESDACNLTGDVGTTSQADDSK